MDPVARPLRFGIAGSGTTFARWEARCIEGLLALPGVVPVLLLLEEGEGAARNARGAPAFLRAHARLLRSDVDGPVDLAPRLGSILTIPSGGPAAGADPGALGPVAVRQVREARLDFVLQFFPSDIRGEALRVPAYGAWAFRFGDAQVGPGNPPGFWEVYRSEPASRAALVRLGEGGDAGVVLQEGWFRTALHSYAATRDAILSGVTGWPAAVVRDLRAGSAAYLGGPPAAPPHGEPRPPTNAQTLRLFGREMGRSASALYRGLVRHDDWTVGVVDAPIQAFLEPDFRPAVRWIPPPGDARFLADPFGLVVDGELQIVYEDFDYRTARGTIAAIRADRPVPRAPPRVAIELGVHASYPYLFHHDGQVYCVPETHLAREVTLYRMSAFPDRWEKVGPLLRDVAAVDSTVFPHDGRWWLLAADHEMGENLRLFVWHAPRPQGPWEPHPLNPVKTDVRSSRPGGTPFVHQGELYRPAQDCARTYGGRIVINRVTRLTPREFQEETVAAVGPFPGTGFPEGVHTLAGAGEHTVLDGKRYRFMPRAVPYVIRRGIEGARP